MTDPDSRIVATEVRTRDLAFGALRCGEGPLALCLHGFPDTAWGWRHLLPALADAGFTAVAPFQRGYAPTAIPGDGAYQTGALASDACALHEALGGDGDAVLIGHDWGAMATYGAASWQPERWRRVVAMSVPPMPVLLAGMMTPRQLRRSWYIWFFQLAAMPELLLAADDQELVATLWNDWSPGYDAAADLVHVRDALATPANVEAAIGYYRAMFDTGGHHSAYADAQSAALAAPTQPALYLHGADDGCIGAELVTDAVLAALPHPTSQLDIVDDAGHFLHLERPAAVNTRIIEFLTAR